MNKVPICKNRFKLNYLIIKNNQIIDRSLYKIRIVFKYLEYQDKTLLMTFVSDSILFYSAIGAIIKVIRLNCAPVCY
jgi:hypothetical protein